MGCLAMADGDDEPEVPIVDPKWTGSPKYQGGGGHWDDGTGNWQPPEVPSGGGSGKKTSVHTPSMLLYAQNIESLLPHIDTALDRLGSVHAAAGGLPAGRSIRKQIGATAKTNGTASGLAGAFYTSLTDLKSGVRDLADAVREMAKKYTVIEDAAKMSAGDLHTYLENTTADFDLFKQHLPSSTGGGGGGAGGAGGGGGGGGGGS